MLDFVILPDNFADPVPLVVLPNGNSIVACHCTRGEICLASLSIEGEIQWTNQIPLPVTQGWVHAIRLGAENSLILTAQLNGDLYVIGVSETGDNLFTVVSHVPDAAWGADVIHLSGDTLVAVLATDTYEATPHFGDIWVAKFQVSDSEYNAAIEPRNHLPLDNLLLTAFPNPFNSTLSISLSIPEHQAVTVSLYDLLGREVDVIHRGRLESSTINYAAPANLASGVYFVRAATGTQTVMQKVVLLK